LAAVRQLHPPPSAGVHGRRRSAGQWKQAYRNPHVPGQHLDALDHHADRRLLRQRRTCTSGAPHPGSRPGLRRPPTVLTPSGRSACSPPSRFPRRALLTGLPMAVGHLTAKRLPGLRPRCTMPLHNAAAISAAQGEHERWIGHPAGLGRSSQATDSTPSHRHRDGHGCDAPDVPNGAARPTLRFTAGAPALVLPSPSARRSGSWCPAGGRSPLLAGFKQRLLVQCWHLLLAPRVSTSCDRYTYRFFWLLELTHPQEDDS